MPRSIEFNHISPPWISEKKQSFGGSKFQHDKAMCFFYENPTAPKNEKILTKYHPFQIVFDLKIWRNSPCRATQYPSPFMAPQRFLFHKKWWARFSETFTGQSLPQFQRSFFFENGSTKNSTAKTQLGRYKPIVRVKKG